MEDLRSWQSLSWPINSPTFKARKTSPPDPALKLINKLHVRILFSLRWILMITSHFILGTPNGIFPSAFRTESFVWASHLPTSVSCSIHLFLKDFKTRIMFSKGYLLCGSSLCNFRHSSIGFSILDPTVILRTVLKHRQITLRPTMTDQVSHPYTTTGTLIWILRISCRIMKDTNLWIEWQQAYPNLICS